MTAETASRKLHWYDHLFINVNWFSLTMRTQVLSGLLVPLLVLKFVGEAQKGAYFGTIRLWSLLVALIMQAFFGLLSDRSGSAQVRLSTGQTRAARSLAAAPWAAASPAL